MNAQKVLALFAVIALVGLAGCSAVSNPFEEKPTEQKIQDSMESIETVEVQKQAFRNVTVKNERSQISQTTDYRVAAKYNLKNNSFIELGQTRERFVQNSIMQQYERYYVNGTSYYRSANTLENETTEWQVEERDINVTEEVTLFADADLLEHYEPEETNNNSTLVYKINLLSDDEHVQKKLEEEQITQFDKLMPYLSIYELEILVDAETHRLQSVRIAAYGTLTQEELVELDDIYESVDGSSTSGSLAYAVEYEFGGYNTELYVRTPNVDEDT